MIGRFPTGRATNEPSPFHVSAYRLASLTRRELICTVSYIGDDFNRRAPLQYPGLKGWVVGGAGPTRAEFEALKREVEELKELLRAAKKYDEATGQKDCEMGDKVALLRKIAELVGVDLSEIFPPEQ